MPLSVATAVSRAGPGPADPDANETGVTASGSPDGAFAFEGSVPEAAVRTTRCVGLTVPRCSMPWPGVKRRGTNSIAAAAGVVPSPGAGREKELPPTVSANQCAGMAAGAGSRPGAAAAETECGHAAGS